MSGRVPHFRRTSLLTFDRPEDTETGSSASCVLTVRFAPADAAGEEGFMRTGGFPCRLLGCDRTFQVVDQKSMKSLTAASGARTDHEISAHGYHHVRLADDASYMSYQRARQKPAKPLA